MQWANSFFVVNVDDGKNIIFPFKWFEQFSSSSQLKINFRLAKQSKHSGLFTLKGIFTQIHNLTMQYLHIFSNVTSTALGIDDVALLLCQYSGSDYFQFFFQPFCNAALWNRKTTLHCVWHNAMIFERGEATASVTLVTVGFISQINLERTKTRFEMFNGLRLTHFAWISRYGKSNRSV